MTQQNSTNFYSKPLFFYISIYIDNINYFEMSFTRYRKNKMPLKIIKLFELLSQRFTVFFLFLSSVFFCGVKLVSANDIFSGLETVGKPIPGGISFQPAVT